MRAGPDNKAPPTIQDPEELTTRCNTRQQELKAVPNHRSKAKIL
jgi:hypothetical protein